MHALSRFRLFLFCDAIRPVTNIETRGRAAKSVPVMKRIQFPAATFVTVRERVRSLRTCSSSRRCAIAKASRITT